MPFKVRLDRAKTISSEDKIALYGLNETIYWNQLDRWNYTDDPTPPNYTLYTGLNLKETFVAFLVISAIQLFAILGASNDNQRNINISAIFLLHN